MKKINQFLIVLSLSAIFLISCNGNKRNENQQEIDTTKNNTETSIDYSGVYKSNSTTNGCDLTITITKTKDGYKYQLTGENYDQEGKAVIETLDATYITFDGPIGNNEPNTVGGQIDGNSILIENYGNSMNEFHYFVDCDEKYLEFVK